MATATLFVQLQTYDARRGGVIPVPNARLQCKHEQFLWDANLSSGNDTTDANGRTSVEITYDDDSVNDLNPYFTITLAEANRAVPDLTPADEQFTLPEDWQTRHYVRRRLPSIIDYNNADDPLIIYIGLPAKLQLSYTDFDASNVRNPMAVPGHCLRFYLADYDVFIFDWLNPDDTMTGVTYNHAATLGADKYIGIGANDSYTHFDTWPTVAENRSTPVATPQACIDAPAEPTGRLGRGGFQMTGALATDLHGFVFMIDGNEVRRFYPNGLLCETISYSFNAPQGLAVDQYRMLYVADTGNHRILTFRLDDRDGQSGAYVYARSTGSFGAGHGQFNTPTDLAVVAAPGVDQNEWLAVADTGNHRVQILRLNVTSGAGIAIRRTAVPGIALPYLSQFGTPAVGSGAADGNPIAQALWQPVAISSDRERNLYVADQRWHRVSKWRVNAAGTGYDHVADWQRAGGGSGNGNGEFDTPTQLTLDLKNRYLYVGERGNNRVQRIDALTGNHLCHWQPNMGASALLANGLASDSRGEVYVADSANNTVLRGTMFDANGTRRADNDPPLQVADLWSSRRGAGQMYAPGYLAHNPTDGALWVADSGNHRIAVYRPDIDGRLNPAPAPAPDGLNNPTGITFDSQTAIIADTGNNRLRSYDQSLNHLSDTGATWSKDPGAVATDSAGNFYVIERDSHRVQKLNAAGQRLLSWGRNGKGRGEFQLPYALAIDSTDTIYVTDGENHRVQKFNANGEYLAEWGIKGSRDGEFNSPKGIAVDSSDNLYVVDNRNYRVQKFDNTGGFISSFGVRGNGNGEFQFPSAITIDATDQVYVSDVVLNEIKKFDASNAFVSKWGGTGSGNGQFDKPRGLGVDNSNNIYVADERNDRIQKFDSAGNFLAGWGIAGSADGELDAPYAVVINNASDRVLVADKGNNRIQVFDLSGGFIEKWGEGGTGDNEFNQPRGLANVVREAGAAMYVADTGNNRVKRLNAGGSISHITEAAAGSSLNAPEDVASDSNGHLYIADTGNSRIVKYDHQDAYLRDIVPTDASLALAAPSGIAVIERQSAATTVIELLVTDRGNNRILLLSQTGATVAYWDFVNLIRQQVAGVDSSGAAIPQVTYDTELARLTLLDRPSNAVLNEHGLLMISDTGHDQVRLLRTHNDYHANLFDLGEALPDISIRCHAEGNWQQDLSLKASAGLDHSVGKIETDPLDDFSEDTYSDRHTLTQTEQMNAATNILKVVRQAQHWLIHTTREDEASHRWQNKTLELFFNLSGDDGSFHPWGADDITMGLDTGGRGRDAWDDSTVVHEMGHWIFDNSCQPEIPYTRTGGPHSRSDIGSPNLAFTEAYAEFHQMFWASGSEFGRIDPVRGFRMTGRGGVLSAIRQVQYDANGDAIPASIVWQYLYGGVTSAGSPTFNQPGKGLENEGYHANTHWQTYHALIAPELLFADSTAFWHRHNQHLTSAQSSRFCTIFRRALREFPPSPTSEQLATATRQYLLQVLTRARATDAGLSQILQTLFELNNQLMPEITVVEELSPGITGPAIDTVAVAAGAAKNLVIRVKDATGVALAGYNLKLTITGTPGYYSLDPAPPPATWHGRLTPSAPPANTLYRATDAMGEIALTCTVPGGAGVNADTLEISYQPDFDHDVTFTPPERNDDREETLRKLYLHELRWAGKTWSGTANNFGAIVKKTFTLNIG